MPTSSAVRFFVDPYRPNRIYILDPPNIKRSDNGGETWYVDTNLEVQLTWNHQIAADSNENGSGVGDYFDLVLTDMKFDPVNPGIRFAVGEGGVFLVIDGVNWTRLMHSAALTGRPGSCYYDWITDPYDPALYVSLAGRGLSKLPICNFPSSSSRTRRGTTYSRSPGKRLSSRLVSSTLRSSRELR